MGNVDWFKKLPLMRRSASGLEWVLWRKLPLIALAGTALPLALVVLLHVLTDTNDNPAGQRWLQMADYVGWGVVIFNWSMILTVAVGCVVVMVMKGPGYVADGYPVSHSDTPRADLATASSPDDNDTLQNK